jgi:Mn-containing catalase
MYANVIAHDTMHQQQWLAVIEELGGYEKQLPIPNSFPQGEEKTEFSYAYFVHNKEAPVPEGRWTQGQSLDGKGQYKPMISEPLGQEPQLAKPRSDSGAQTDQMGMGSSIAAAASSLVSGGPSTGS